jgi:hypothetical protein
MPDFSQNFNRYSYCLNNPLVYVDEDGESLLLLIGGAILGAYLGGLTSNKGELNPLKWNWKDATYILSVGNNTGPSGGIGDSAGIGWNDRYTTNIGYNQKSGVGIEVGRNGSTNMYYPGYDYNKPEKNAIAATEEAGKLNNMQQQIKNNINSTEILFSTVGSSGYLMSKSNATFRITNGEYNGNQISLKLYNSGWKGGSRAQITTYSVSKLGQSLSMGAGAITTGMAYNEIYNGSPQPITYVDAGVGTAGVLSSVASYYTGVQVPIIGETVAIYGTLRLVWDTFFYLGANYGPSKWYGDDNTKWFK